MASHAGAKPDGAARGAMGTFAGRVDPLTSAILVFPVLLVYQLGILLSRGRNGVDYLTASLVELSERDLGNYLWMLGGLMVGYAALIILLRQRQSFDPRSFVPILAESTFYALTMGSIILFVMHRFVEVVPGLALMPALSIGGGELALIDIVVISAGAGLHEELIFRLGGVGGLSWLLAGITGEKRAWIWAAVISSLVFSLAHHVGPSGEAFEFAAFAYRGLAGLFFAIVYQVRGFAVAVWTHALYDVYVLSLG